MRSVSTVSYLCGALALAACSGSGAQGTHDQVESVAQSFLDERMTVFDRVDAPGCTATLSRNGVTLASGAYGLANLDHDIPLSTDSVFRVASVSKQFTAFAILLLADDGALDLEDDIREWLPELPDYGHVVNILHLLEHSSGLPYYGDIGFPYEDVPDYIRASEGDDTSYGNPIFLSDSEFFERVLKVETLHYPPGEKSSYNNVGYYLLGKIVERASGQHLRDFAKERIFQPLGMDDTFFNTHTHVTVKRRASPYFRLKDGRYIEWQTDLNWIGDGGLFTTVDDLAKWEANFQDNQLGGGADLIELMVRPNSNLEYDDDFDTDGGGGAAKGLFIVPTDFGLVAEHGGAWVGFRTHTERHLESGYSIFMLCNTFEAAEKLPDLPRGILKAAIQSDLSQDQ
ncbi:MAG: serine hydrolase domain-containing protein [Henriciella sp.]